VLPALSQQTSCRHARLACICPPQPAVTAIQPLKHYSVVFVKVYCCSVLQCALRCKQPAQWWPHKAAGWHISRVAMLSAADSELLSVHWAVLSPHLGGCTATSAWPRMSALSLMYLHSYLACSSTAGFETLTESSLPGSVRGSLGSVPPPGVQPLP